MQILPAQTMFVLILAILVLLFVILAAMLLARRAGETKVKTYSDEIGFLEQSKGNKKY